jgi:aryl-alcohol dehydrogenase-like predicted oxidoreductase
MSKLALGSVQFGLPYGINNHSGVPSDQELKSIFCFAHQKGIKVIDTAQGYGNAEERIGKFIEYNFDIITKFKKLTNPFPFLKELKESLGNLNAGFVYGYMAHDGDLLIENPEWWEGLKEAKNIGLVKKIGYSIYSIDQLDILISLNMIPDIVQVPYNILDRRFEYYFAKMKQMGVEIHTRSVFLQGLFFMSLDKLPPKLLPLKPVIQEILNISDFFKIPVSTMALKFVIQNPHIDKVLIGVDSKLQLEENLQILSNLDLSNELLSRLNNIVVTEKGLLSPVNWT